MKNYVTPHCHPQSLDTGCTVESFVKREKELGTGHITVTDHGSMGACRKVYDQAQKAGLKPILGLEAYFFDENCPVLKAHGVTDFREYVGDYMHVTLHFLDQQAYETGVRLLSLADERAVVKFGERKPPLSWKDLEELGGTNTTVGTGCLGGMVQAHINQRQRPDIAAAYFDRLCGIFKPGNVYAEVFPHEVSHDFVSRVSITFEDGTKEEFAQWKKLRVDSEEIQAGEFAKACSRKKKGPYGCLTAVMDNRAWVIRPGKTIVKIEAQEGFVQNECSPLAPNGDLQWACNKFVLIQAKKRGIPVLVSDDSHFGYPEDKIVQDIRLSSNGRTWRFYSSYHRQESEESFAYLSKSLGVERSEFEGWVENSYEWASRFDGFKFTDRKVLPTSFYPSDTLRHLNSLIQKHGRMDWSNEAMVARLKSEVQLLHFNGTIDLLPYFFVAEEGCSFCEQRRKLTGPGRGSAAGLLLTYLLGITHVDPLRYNLSQDRFLTLDRVKSGKLPDIDQDLPDVGVLVDPEHGWLKSRFGDCYAQISTDTTLKLRSSVKDVARYIHGSVPKDIEILTKDFQNAPQGISDRDFVFGYQKDGEEVPGSLYSDPKLQAYIKKYPKEWEIVQQCLGVVRGHGRHASAYCIVNEPIYNFIPLTTISGVKVTQYDMRSVEAVGGVKMDYLGLNSLNDIGNAVLMIQERVLGKQLEEAQIIDGKRVPAFRIVPFKGKMYDIWDLPSDQNVFSDVCAGRTETVFQFGTESAKQWLALFDFVSYDGTKGLRSIEDLAAFTALDRPGPLDYKVEGKHNMLQEYAIRAQGGQPSGALPILDRLFPETMGVIVFQEQLQKAFQEIGGTTGIQANAFREHIAKKKMDLVFKDKALFMPGAIEKLGPEVAEQLWQSMETFGQYGFNKSHAVCYSVIGYACAWLKHHYKLEWWCAVLQNANKNEIVEKFWPYCGDLIDMPDVNLSGETFAIQNGRIRAPISLLHGIGPAALKQLNESRPFKDIRDFCEKSQKCKAENGRSAMHSGVISSMIVAGVMDSLFPPGTSLLDQFKLYADVAKSLTKLPKAKRDELDRMGSQFVDCDPYLRYQMRKKVLPAFSEPLLPTLISRGDAVLDARDFPVIDVPVGAKTKRYRFVDYLRMEDAIQRAVWNDAIEIAVVGYVVAERRFRYGPDKDKEGLSITIDLNDCQAEFVKWPDNDGKQPKELKDGITGAIVVLTLRKYAEDKPFTVTDVITIRKPLNKEQE